MAAAIDKIAKPIDLAPLTKGGKARFTETVTTQGKRGDDKTAYTMDTLTPPFKNPYKSWMRFGGFDFFSDGRAAISTWTGDVWIVSGIDDDLQKLTWKRYAAGLFHALGLKIVNDKVYVLGRDQITRLHDLNGDGEADFYECFNNDAMITTNFHEFTFDLQTDTEGNFYFVKGGPVRPGGRGWDKITPHHGCIFKVSKDGSKLEVIARGFRAPNGMGVGPNGEITTGDNEGTWTPTCPINWIKPGGFYGVPDFAGKPKDEFPKVRDNPLCWLPHNEVDNSNGGQTWITGKNFGPLSGQLMHTSYGKSQALRRAERGSRRPNARRRRADPHQLRQRHLPAALQRKGKRPLSSPACAAGRPTPPRTPASIASATPARRRTCPSISRSAPAKSRSPSAIRSTNRSPTTPTTTTSSNGIIAGPSSYGSPQVKVSDPKTGQATTRNGSRCRDGVAGRQNGDAED